MALDYKDRYKERVSTTFEYPFGKAINASSDTSDDGTPFEQDYINDQWGFFQKLLVDTGQTPNGVVDTANNSQYVDALKIMFREPLGENVFVAINRGFLAKITFYPVGGSGSIYKVFDANTNQPVDIYANKEGSVLIPQNDINNVASPEGDIIFFISDGDYYITINTQKIEFSVVSNLSSVSNQIVDIGDDVSTIRGDLNETINDILDLKNYNKREGAKVGSTLYSLYTKNEDVDQALFYTELKLLDQRKRDLDIGDSVALVDHRLTSVADDQGALAQEVLQLTAATGVIGGQVTATVSRVNQAETDILGNAQAISALTTSVENTIGDLSDAQLILDSTVDELGVVSSRAYLGVSNTVDGKTTVTGITADSETNGLRFQGDVIQFDDTLGNPALQYRADLDKWVFSGQVVIGNNYVVDSEDDIRALDGDTIYEKYQYSVDGTSNWHDDFVDGDLYRRTATVTNGAVGAWSTATRITGYTPEIINNPDGSVTISNGAETATVYDGENAPIPTLTDNGDGTYTIDNGAGDSVTISNGAEGVAGYNSATVYLYQRKATVPNKPSTTSTYNFNTKTITGFNNGWSTTVPNGNDDLYVIVATASSRETTDNILGNEWTSPSILTTNGADGENGLNSATVYLYRRSSSVPALPTSTSTYTFSTGKLTGQNNNWSQTVPAGDNPLYVITATAISTSATDTINGSEWANAKILVQDGSDGDTIYERYQYSVTGTSDWHTNFVDGDLFRRSSTVTNGVTGAWSSPARITGYTPVIIDNGDGSVTISNGTDTAVVYDGLDGQDAPIPTVTDNGNGSYTIDNGAGDTVVVNDGADGKTPIKGVDYFDGLDGSFVSNIYRAVSSGTPTTPSGGSFNGTNETIPSGWRDTPYYEAGKITFVSTSRYRETVSGVWENTGWSSPSEYIIKGETGVSGVNSTIVFLYKRSANEPSKPSSTSTYNFSTKVLTGFNKGWSTSVPEGAEDLYIIGATASSRSSTDTISPNEWSTPSVLSSNGDDGIDGLNVATVFLYKRSETAPTKPTSQSTFTFSSGTLTGQNNGWTQTVPSGTQPVYITTATASSQNTTDIIPSSEWATPEILAQNGETPVKGVDYFDGLDGSFVSNIYRTYSTGAPSTPNGGSFNGTTETFPTGWQDTPYYESGKITYISTTRYKETSSGVWQHNGWSVPSEYIVKGQDGADGKTTYTWIKYADTSTGAGLSDNPTGKEYIGFAYNKTTPTESNTASNYTWSLIKGTDGVKGADGADGQTTYTWIAYSNYADGTNLYQVPNANTLYIGIAVNKTTATESSNKADYTWSKFKGDKGVAGQDGARGPQGVQGPKGADGQTTYTWIRYADTSTGGGISNNPAGKEYIGFAYNKTTPTESNNRADYTWSLIKGTDGVKGDKGADGQTTYTWIAYSNYADGTSLYQTPNDNTKYIGIAVNKTTPTESNNKSDYTWSKFKGDKGESAFTNLIKTEGQWTVDTSGSQGIFSQNGSTAENRVELLVGPAGVPELVWNTFAGHNGADGGWDVNATIDPTRSYRHSVWMKQVGGKANTLYLGCSGVNTSNLDGTVNTNPYHWSGDLHQLDKWYLAVGIIHGNSYSGGASGISGIYDPDTGEKVSSGVDLKNRTGTSQTQRVFRYYATQPTHTAQFARPRFEEINGEEMSLGALMGRIPKDGQDGADGQVGAGFYGSTYSSISWSTSTANSRFTSLVGRSPVKGDIFTQTRTNGTDSQARQYNGSSWGSVALQVNGSIVASRTIAGDKLIAGTSISAPKITGGELNGAVINGGELNIKSSPSGARTEITESLIKVYNSSGNLVVRIGVW